MADNGTTDCKTTGTASVNTGSRSGCVSHFGAFDMVGNLMEWVADWVPFSTSCPGWGAFSDDGMCLSGASTTNGPGALVRSGAFSQGVSSAGPFAVFELLPSNSTHDDVGFRGAR